MMSFLLSIYFLRHEILSFTWIHNLVEACKLGYLWVFMDINIRKLTQRQIYVLLKTAIIWKQMRIYKYIINTLQYPYFPFNKTTFMNIAIVNSNTPACMHFIHECKWAYTTAERIQFIKLAIECNKFYCFRYLYNASWQNLGEFTKNEKTRLLHKACQNENTVFYHYLITNKHVKPQYKAYYIAVCKGNYPLVRYMVSHASVIENGDNTTALLVPIFEYMRDKNRNIQLNSPYYRIIVYLVEKKQMIITKEFLRQVFAEYSVIGTPIMFYLHHQYMRQIRVLERQTSRKQRIVYKSNTEMLVLSMIYLCIEYKYYNIANYWKLCLLNLYSSNYMASIAIYIGYHMITVLRIIYEIVYDNVKILFFVGFFYIQMSLFIWLEQKK